MLDPGSPDDEPSYMNYLYLPDDMRPTGHQGRIRISFSKGFLTNVLREMLNHEEAESTASGWVVGRFPTRRV